MDKSTIFQEALSKEFSCYYIADGFENGWENSIDELASDSAVRLYRCLDDDSIQEFVRFLNELRNDPDHPFVEILSDETLIDWTDNPLIWQALQKILGLIGDNLVNMKQAQPSAISSSF
jgi:hypothetical protein